MVKARHRIAGLLVSLMATVAVAHAAQPLSVPKDRPVFSAPMAVIDGKGAIPFHVTLGMLVTKDGTPVGLYRSYPSKSLVPLSEMYGLGMLGTHDGVILASYLDIPLLILHGHIDGALGVYPLTVDYLSGTAPRRYATCTLRVAHTPQGVWETVDAAGRPIRTFTVKTTRAGISGIDPCGK